MFVDSSAKAAIQERLNNAIKALSKPDKLSSWAGISEIRSEVDRLEVISDLEIHFVFDELDYDLVWALQADVDVDQSLTPQTKASIRISLGYARKFLADSR